MKTGGGRYTITPDGEAYLNRGFAAVKMATQPTREFITWLRLVKTMDFGSQPTHHVVALLRKYMGEAGIAVDGGFMVKQRKATTQATDRYVLTPAGEVLLLQHTTDVTLVDPTGGGELQVAARHCTAER